MEVLSCSGIQHVRESDCLQQVSGTTFMYGAESNCIERGEKVQVADVKVYGLVLNTGGPPEERQREAQWTVDDLPGSEVHCNGASYFELEAEAQKFSCDSHESEDENLNAQEFFAETSVASESSHLIVDTIDSGLSGNREEEEPSISGPQWLERDDPVAVWVKVRVNIVALTSSISLCTSLAHIVNIYRCDSCGMVFLKNFPCWFEV